MANIDQICQICDPKVTAVFNPANGSRDKVTITGPLFTTERCFVADEIRFVDPGQLIFRPHVDGDVKRYEEEYVVICRKLIIVGGNAPITLNPCKADDPGQTYQNNNAITWEDRLKPAPDVPNPSPIHAPNGASHDQNNW